jgi:hypothetical protein
MKRAAFALIAALALAGLASGGAARAGHSPTAYYVSLGDSLAASTQPNGDFQHGYAEQLYAELREQDSGIKLVKLGCGGESTTSMLYGSQDPAVAKSCGPRHANVPKGGSCSGSRSLRGQAVW